MSLFAIIGFLATAHYLLSEAPMEKPHAWRRWKVRQLARERRAQVYVCKLRGENSEKLAQLRKLLLETATKVGVKRRTQRSI